MSEGREICYSCLRPTAHCFCQSIAPTKAHCNILILQHPNERRKYYSTAKLVTRAFTNARIMRGLTFNPDELAQTLRDQTTYLLFPSEVAQDCTQVRLTESSTVIVVDGTWSEAGKIISHNSFLKNVPCISFSQPLRSNYRIRKQPKEFCLSTLESVGHLLKLSSTFNTQAQNKYDALFDCFDRMVEQQLQYIPLAHRQMR